MDSGNSIELTSSHCGKKRKVSDKVFKGGSAINRIKAKIPNEAIKLFEGGK